MFQRELYASVSLTVCLLFLGLRAFGLGEDLSTVVSFAAGMALRLAAIRAGWKLPTFSYRVDW